MLENTEMTKPTEPVHLPRLSTPKIVETREKRSEPVKPTTSKNVRIEPELDENSDQIIQKLEEEIRRDIEKSDLNVYVSNELNSTFNLGLNY